MDRCWTLVLQPTPKLFWGSNPVVWNLHYRRRVSLMSAVHLVVQRSQFTLDMLSTCAWNRIFKGWQWVGVISPVFVYSLLRFGSGVPLLERRSNVKWGSDPAYVAYLERVSCAYGHFHKQNSNPPTPPQLHPPSLHLPRLPFLHSFLRCSCHVADPGVVRTLPQTHLFKRLNLFKRLKEEEIIITHNQNSA